RLHVRHGEGRRYQQRPVGGRARHREGHLQRQRERLRPAVPAHLLNRSLIGTGPASPEAGPFLFRRRYHPRMLPKNWWPLVLWPAMVLPSLVWACLDLHPWPWDQAYYGEYTLRILGAFGEGPISGVASMGLSMPSRAPGLTWIGAPFALLADLF